VFFNDDSMIFQITIDPDDNTVRNFCIYGLKLQELKESLKGNTYLCFEDLMIYLDCGVLIVGLGCYRQSFGYK